MKEIDIRGRKIGGDNPCFIVAELSCNHFHSLDIAKRTLDAMKDSGADAVKVQIDDPDGGITINCENEYFQVEWQGKNRTLYDLYRETSMPWLMVHNLQLYAKQIDLVFFGSVSCTGGVDTFPDLPLYKISSFEANDYGLICRIIETGRPMLISTGCSSAEDIIGLGELLGGYPHALLNCVSKYPARTEDYSFDLDGISDHSKNAWLPHLLMGGKIIEHHFILSKSLGGPDVDFSFEPNEFKEMVKIVRLMENSLKPGREIKIDKTYCKSIFVVKDMKAGDRFTEENVAVIRPGFGMSPLLLPDVLEATANDDIKRGTPLREGLLEVGE